MTFFSLEMTPSHCQTNQDLAETNQEMLKKSGIFFSISLKKFSSVGSKSFGFGLNFYIDKAVV